MSVDGYRAEVKSLADELAAAKLRGALMDKYGRHARRKIGHPMTG